MPDKSQVTDVDVVLRVYSALTELAGPGEGWGIDLALVVEIEQAMQAAVDFAESDAQAERATEAVAAARQLRHAIRAYGQVE